MTRPLSEMLDHFETALDAKHLDYEVLISIFREIELPGSPEAGDLDRLFACCYRILDFEKSGFNARLYQDLGDWCAGHLEACAGELIESVMYDRNASSRAWIADRIKWHQENDREVPEEYLDHDLPPAIVTPWDKETARARVKPLLDYWASTLTDVPTAHFNLAWKVLHDGYPLFRQIVKDWMRDLDARRLGCPGTPAAFTKADELLELADAETPRPWSECERDLIPLLRDPHPMIVGGAARTLGAFYAFPGFPDDDNAPDLLAMLEQLSSLEEFRAIACGGFVCGFDSEIAGLYTLKTDSRIKKANFDLDGWILGIVAHDDYEPYLPNAQSLWFYIHEHYCTTPDMVMTFIDKGQSWLAMMCATEVHEAVDGMKPVLERLAKDPEPEVSESAQMHLDEHYG